MFVEPRETKFGLYKTCVTKLFTYTIFYVRNERSVFVSSMSESNAKAYFPRALGS